MQTTMTSSKPVNPYNSMQICLMLRNIIFNWDFCYFEDISDKFTADVDVTYMMTSSCMMMSTLVYFVYYYL